MPTRLGQNFLVSEAWQHRVAAAVAPEAGDLVLEIGGGAGEISRRLAASGCRLHIVELDAVLARRLTAEFAAAPTVRVWQGDILSLDLAAIAGEVAPGARVLRVCGNLPYYISAPILLRLFAFSALIRDAVVMLQKEVADRLVAAPGTREFGLLSATTQYFCSSRHLFDIPAGAFRPPPRVISTLIQMAFAPTPAASSEEEARFLGFLRLSFAQKRKRLANNLKPRYGVEATARALAALGIGEGARAEQLPAGQLWELFRRLAARAPSPVE